MRRHLVIAVAVVAGGHDKEAALLGESVDGALEVGGVAVRGGAGLAAVRVAHDAHALAVAPASQLFTDVSKPIESCE